ncbi:MAG: methionyl-tRNA formyltransferase [Candidatus Hydrogenedentota bacterium]
MRTVFFGTPELAVPTLAAVAEHHDVLAVVCQPDRPRGRGRKPEPPPTKAWALDRGIPVVQPEKLNDGSFEHWLKGQAPQVCTLAAYGRILKQPLLDVPPHGFLNVHPSLLPKYRGPSPIQSAILEGETETGVTIMKISLEMDAGDIQLQERVPIQPEDTGETLTARLAMLGGEMMVRALDLVNRGEATFTPQDESAATYCKLFEKADGRIDWTQPAARIHNLIRAAQPWPIAHGAFRGDIIRILASEVLDEPATAAPGTVTRAEKDRLVVSTGKNLLAILRIQPPGKRPMAVGDYLRGHAVAPGERFESVP